jgi:hypothetical protein
MATKRTTHRSAKGTKLYAVRGKKGEFKDIQTYKRAHGQDIKRKSKKRNDLGRLASWRARSRPAGRACSLGGSRFDRGRNSAGNTLIR